MQTHLTGTAPELDPAADAEALLNIAWGKPGNPLIGHWAAQWLVGDWRGQELGMAAADAQRRLGYKNVAALLSLQSGGNLDSENRTLLGAAWLNQVAEMGGVAQVHKLYSARIPKLGVAEVTSALGTTPPELERKWQMWIYAYIAGMPAAAPNSTAMPPHMHMTK